MSIPCFIPSKDRAAQLHLLLESLEKNAVGVFDPHVLCTFSNTRFEQGYDRIVNEFPKVRFSIEENAEHQFYEFLGNYAEKDCVVGLFTDDSVFYRPANFTEKDINNIFKKENVWSFHIRLGKNITITDYVTNKNCPQPNQYEIIDNRFMMWSYRNAPCSKFDSYFYFASPFDGCLYWAKDLLFLMNNCHFSNIILYEHEICNNGMQDKTPKDKIVCPLESNVVVQNINSSHSYGHRSNNHFCKSLEELNTNYISGKIIDLDSMNFDVKCCHSEIPFEFKET